MTTAAQPTGPELDQALARAIRQLIASAVETGDLRGAGDAPGAVVPAA